MIFTNIFVAFFLFYLFLLRNQSKFDLHERIERNIEFKTRLDQIRSELKKNKTILILDKKSIESFSRLDNLLEKYLFNSPERIFFQGRLIQERIKNIDFLFSKKIWLLDKRDKKAGSFRLDSKRKICFFSADDRTYSRDEYIAKLKEEIENFYYEYLFFEELLLREYIIYPKFVWIFLSKLNL